MARTQIMGILNATPDSFFEGSRVSGAEAARLRGEAMVLAGADWLDIGGESSRPGAAPVSQEEELRRVVPIFEAMQGLGAKLSVDTYRAETARRAIALGAAMVNDITALRGDPAMAEVVAEAGCAVVLMHMLGTPQTMQRDPQYNDVGNELYAFFEERMTAALRAGIREEQIWLDPGFGFGKTVDHNLTLLRRLREFRRFGRPLLVGTSNKATIGQVLGGEVEDRTEGTAATVAVSIVNGADCVRVHDVHTMARVARMTDAIVYGRENHHG